MFKNKSLLGSFWKLEDFDERLILSLSQKKNISPLLAKFLSIRGINENTIDHFLHPEINKNFPNPFLLKDMKKAVNRVFLAIQSNEKIGIIADYDVDGSTSASILYKFLQPYVSDIFIHIPNRLNEGYGPNIRIMDELLNEKVKLVFTLDCGTSAHNIIDNPKYKSIEVIVIDHHLSEIILPNVFSIINPNRFDENNNFNQLAAVGVTFLFLMGLRKYLRDKGFFNEKTEPNLFSYLDLVAIGTICDVVKLTFYNRLFVKIGLKLIKQRKHSGISHMIDNSNLSSTPTSSDLSYVIGPQLNAASRIDNSSLPTKLLTSNNIEEIDSICKKLKLLNEKRKLIESDIFNQALKQAEKQKKNKYILVYGKYWHNGVLGIVASKLISIFFKPSIVISFQGSLGIGSCRSINNVDLGQIILEAKDKNILLSGGGHKMAAGLKINFEKINLFSQFLDQKFDLIPNNFFESIEKFDSLLSVNQINNELIEIIEMMEPYGSGNHELKFIVNDLNIESIKILKQKHLLIFFKNNFSKNLRAICFNCIDTILGDYLLNFKKYKFYFSCTIKRNKFFESNEPQIIIKDAIIIN